METTIFIAPLIIIIFQSRVPSKARISSLPVLAYNHQDSSNASSDMEITNLYSMDSLSIPRKFPPALSTSDS